MTHLWPSPPLLISLWTHCCSSDVYARWKVCEAIIYPELDVLRPQQWWPQDHVTGGLLYRFPCARVHPAKAETEPGSEAGSCEILGITLWKQRVLLSSFTSCERVTIKSLQNTSNDTSVLATSKLKVVRDLTQAVILSLRVIKESVIDQDTWECKQNKTQNKGTNASTPLVKH